MFRKTNVIHFLAGLAYAAIASPFGIVAAALAPVILGFSKEMFCHFNRRHADTENHAWVVAGAATFVMCYKLLPIKP